MIFRIIGILIALLAIGFVLSDCSGKGGPPNSNADRNSKLRDLEKADEVTDDLKAQIIREIVATLNPKSHVVSDDANLYLMVPDDVFKKLPEKINGIKLIAVSADQVTKDFHNNYVVFDEWAKSGDLVVLRDMAYFWGGNTGGCVRRFAKTGDKWTQLKPECFAAAS